MEKITMTFGLAALFFAASNIPAQALTMRDDFMDSVMDVRQLPETARVTLSGTIRDVYDVDGFTLVDSTGEVNVTLDGGRNDLRPGQHVVVQGFVDDADFWDAAEVDDARILHLAATAPEPVPAPVPTAPEGEIYEDMDY